MLKVTKIFRFEMAHAIHGYSGACQHIHGHSYILHVSVQMKEQVRTEYLPGTGFIIDFKDLKSVIKKAVIDRFDHQLVLSEEFLKHHPHTKTLGNLHIWPMEPSAENIILYIRQQILQELPPHVELCKLKLYETADSYAEL